MACPFCFLLHPVLLLSLLGNNWLCSKTQLITTAPSNEDTGFVCIYTSCLPEDPATYTGGTKAWLKYLADSTIYPDIAYAHRTEGVVRIQFTILENGSVTNVQPLNELTDSLREAAVQVVQASPKWRPAMRNGKPVRWRTVQQFTFKMDEEDLPVCDSIVKPAIPIL